ncbi:MAG: DNA-deoxyinosine glycosylase [Christensenellales bacterium]|jgi:TDG/mug DNA glycosylase family protein
MQGEILTGFPPVFNGDSKVLILGSFPSVMSRQVNFYYGNRHNRFWRVLSEIFSEEIGSAVEDKIKFLLNNKIALADIVSGCRIKGSLDSGIKDYTVRDLSVIFNGANIIKILCNGRKSYELTYRNYKNSGIPIIYLPSTSPANTAFDISQWREELKILMH